MITHPRGDNGDPRRVEAMVAWESGRKRIILCGSDRDCHYPDDDDCPMGGGDLGI